MTGYNREESEVGEFGETNGNLPPENPDNPDPENNPEPEPEPEPENSPPAPEPETPSGYTAPPEADK